MTPCPPAGLLTPARAVRRGRQDDGPTQTGYNGAAAIGEAAAGRRFRRVVNAQGETIMLTLRPYWPCLVLAVLAGCSQPQAPQAPQVALMNQAEPLPGVTTAGQPDAASLEALADAGYTAVIDLRTPEEDRGFDEKGTVEKLGMRYISLPISGGDGVTFENASRLDETLAGIDGPVLLHCASSNRVGALLTLREVLKGAKEEEALELGTEAGLKSLRGTVEERLSER